MKKKGIGDGTLTSMLTSLFAVQSGTRRRRDERREETNGILGGWSGVVEGGGGVVGQGRVLQVRCYRLSIFYLVLQRQLIMP